MAVGAITVVKQGVVGNMKYGVVDVVGPASYTTTGDALDLNAVLGFTNIYAVDVFVSKIAPPAVNAPIPLYDAVSKKLQLFGTAANALGATEATSTTVFSNQTFRFLVFGS